MHRELREEDRFRERLSELHIPAEHWDEVSRGLYFVLSRRPDLFRSLGPREALRVAHIECFKGLPKLHVLFAYDDRCVYLLDVYLPDSEET